jgi:tryptophan-rich sensory protein
MKTYIKPLAAILILQVLAFLTSYFVTKPAVSGWYQSLNKSALNPPDWVFAPVWTLLYTLLGIVLWRLWRLRAAPMGEKALTFFVVQMGLNYSWSYVFFGLGAFASAFFILLVMIALTILTIKLARSADPLSAKLLYPYLAWISFAAYLNYAVMTLN